MSMEKTMTERMNEFVEKYKIEEEGKEELMSLLNESLVVISKGILNSVKVNEEKEEKKNKVKKEKVEKVEKLEGIKKYKSRKAEEYAMEHGIEIEEFEMLEISKKDVENKIKEKTKNENKNEKISVKKDKKENKEEVKKERVICSGISKKGEACKSTGTLSPEGSKKKYCFRHAEDWKSFECESDSSEEEEEKEKCKEIEKEEEKEKCKEIEKEEESEKELEEEEYSR